MGHNGKMLQKAKQPVKTSAEIVQSFGTMPQFQSKMQAHFGVQKKKSKPTVVHWNYNLKFT